MNRTFSIVALTLALALATSGPSSALAARSDPAGSTPGIGVPQARPTKADCLDSFRAELQWCGTQFAGDDILRQACVDGALAILEDCIASL